MIRASAATISDIRFPSGGKGQVRGFDGWLDAVGVPPYVPDGKSIWEFGVSGATGTKLTADHDKRTAKVPAVDRKDLTLVLVTPFTWDDPQVTVVDWVKAKNNAKAWKYVRLLEGPHLVNWLEDRPSVAARWARKMGAQPAEVRSTDEYWEEFSSRFQRPISEGVVLCGREKKAEKLIEGLMRPNGPVAFVADSPEEVVAFAVAAIRKADPATRDYLEARTLVVDSEAAGRALRIGKPAVFLPRGQGMASIGLLAAKGPTLKAGSYDRPDQGADILDRPSTHDLAKAFEDMGLDRGEAAKVARDCGRSITVLARTYQGAGFADKPGWQDAGDKLIAPLLAVGWDALHDKDKDNNQAALPRGGTGQDKAVEPTYESLAIFYAALARRVLNLAQGNAGRSAELVPFLERFGGEPWDEAIAQLDALMASSTPDDRRPVWDALVQLRDRHRRFASAEWAMQPDHLAQIESLVDAYAPAGTTAKFGDLFDDWFPSIGGAVDPDDEAVLQARREAAREILQKPNAKESLIDLAAQSKLPWSVGQAAAHEINDLDTLAELIASAVKEPTNERLEFAASISSIARQRFPDTWPDRLKALIAVEALVPDQAVRLIFPWPETDATWDFVEGLGPDIDKVFWATKRAFRIKPGDANLIRTVRKYIEVRRPGDALDAASDRLKELTTPIVLQLLDAHIDGIVESGGKNLDSVMGTYRLDQVLKFLDATGEISLEELAARELRIFPLLHHSQRALSLHALMAKSGAFYAQILAFVYPTEPKDSLSEEAKAKRRRLAEAGFRMLHDFSLSPGLTGDPPTVDKDTILAWTSEVRAANPDPERNALYDIYIGQALAHAPLDVDGGWPHRALREALETLAAPDIERGMATERFNMRGVFMKSIYEGGGQERAIAADYRAWRDLAAAWPRTSALLESMAARWDFSAEESDLRARQDLMRD